MKRDFPAVEEELESLKDVQKVFTIPEIIIYV